MRQKSITKLTRIKSRFFHPVFILGLLNGVYWVLDTYNIIFFLHKPQWMLWYSSIGLGLTAVALLLENSFLLSVLFIALFLVEGIWMIGFFSILVFNIHIPGVAEYAFDSSFSKKDFYITLFHIFLVPSLFIGLSKVKKIYSNGWIGASGLAIILAFFSYIFSNSKDILNCVHVLTYCRSAFSLLGWIRNPYRVLFGIFLIILFVYIPTNFLLVKLARVFKWKITKIHFFWGNWLK